MADPPGPGDIPSLKRRKLYLRDQRLNPEEAYRRLREGLIDDYSSDVEQPVDSEDIERHAEATLRGLVEGEEEVHAMPDDVTDAKIAAAEARTDAKLAGFQGQFDVLSLKLDNIAASIKEQRTEAGTNRTAIVTTVVAVGFALAGLLVTVAAYGDSVFSRGMSVRDVVDAAVHDVQKQTPANKP